MNSDVTKKTSTINDKNSRKTRWKRVISSLALIVVFCTTYSLVLPAITLEKDPTCGMEEHVHDESCYRIEKVLICGKEESEGHTHDETCYAKPELICDKPETEGHVHDENCYDAEGNLICGKEESEGHTHDETCYAKPELICDKPESEGHVHDESCYEERKVLICDKPEHTHTDACYAAQTTEEAETEAQTEAAVITGDENADAETPEIWEKTFADVVLTKDLKANAAAIARTQIGYQESVLNFVQTQGQDPRGYTRYGEWAGDKYSDWNSLFVLWCLHYSGMQEGYLGESRECLNWPQKLVTEDHYILPENYIPAIGDIIFLDAEDQKQRDGIADLVGIVADLAYDEQGSLKNLIVIMGDDANAVTQTEWTPDNERILGYGVLPEQPDEMISKEYALEDGSALILSCRLSSLPFPAEELEFVVKEIHNEKADEGERWENAAELIQNECEEKTVPLYSVRLFDITLLHNGEEVEPCGPVTLSFNGMCDPEAAEQSYAVYHIDEENETAQEQEAQQDEQGNLVIDTDHFSIYGVASFLDVSLLANNVPGIVQTVDSRGDGIILNLFDYYGKGLDQSGNVYGSPVYKGINNLRSHEKDNYLLFFVGGTGNGSSTSINNYTGSGNGAMQGIVNNTLTNGYPTLRTNGSSLDYLFDTDNRKNPDYNKKNDPQEYAKIVYPNVNHLFQKDQDGYYIYDSNLNYARYNNNGNFTVYNGTYKTSGGKPIGFFPFNDYNSSKNSVSGDSYYNHHFGLTMTADFMIPEGAKVNGKDMIFEFSGDDDVWVFIDDVLVLDIGGIHDATSGSINFTTGEVLVAKAQPAGTRGSKLGTRNNIYNIFSTLGKTFDGSDFSEHKISFFYMERGGQESNCKLKFNLPVYAKKSLTIEKKMDGTESEELLTREYKFQLYLTKGQGSQNYELYKGPAQYSDETEVQFADDGTFTLIPGQKIIFPEMVGLRKYQIKEVGLNSSEIEKVLVNGVEYTPAQNGNGYEITTEPMPIRDRCEVVCTNTAPTIDLIVKKEWSDDNKTHEGGWINYHILRRHAGTSEEWQKVFIDEKDTFQVGSNDNWTVTIPHLPKKDGSLEYEYKIIEDSVSGYYPTITSTINGSVTTFMIQNNKEPEKTKIAVEKKWFNSDGTTTSPFTQEIEVELWRRYTVPAPASSHTVRFYVNAYTADQDGNTITTKVEIGAMRAEVAEGGSISFASALWNSRKPDGVYAGSNCSFEKTDQTYQIGDAWVPVYKCSNIRSDVNVSLTYDGIWESSVQDVKIKVTDKTEPENQEQPGTVMEEKVAAVILNAGNEWSYEWKPSDIPAENASYTPYKYFVKEIEVPGFTVTYENNDGIEQGTITIKNTAVYSYKLPATGGIGTKWYTYSGLMFIAAALVYGCCSKFWKGRRSKE